MAKRPTTSEQDNVWKELLDYYFQEFMLFFFPEIYQDIDWKRGYESLDKELAKIVRDSKLGHRLADKLVKVYLKNGSETWLLIHLEVQGYIDADFEKRMFVYNYRIFDKYGHEVISLAVLTDNDPSYRPSHYEVRRWGFEHVFRFPAIKLLDYAQKWNELEANANPFAIVVMAHLKAQQIRKADERLAWKLRLTRMLYERGYQRQDIIELFRFLDWLVTLPEKLEQVYYQEIDQYEAELKMPYTTSFERIGMQRGMEKGLEQGLQQGLQQGLLEGIEMGLTIKFGQAVFEALLPQIEEIEDIEQLRELTKVVMEAGSEQEVRNWLATL
jgi:hypothetical protein